MAEKPILFSTPMVQAILDGRKTQTRRVIKIDDAPENWGKSTAGTFIIRTSPYDAKLSRYASGDILWVRETWAPCATIDSWIDGKNLYVYKADYAEKGVPWKWRPSIFMPREAARIFLKVTNVRVERVQEILCGDMKREGCIPDTVVGGQYQQWQRDYWIPLWDSVNKKRGYGWDSNPWVFVYTFERTQPYD